MAALFGLTDECEGLRQSVRRLAEQAVAPHAAGADEREEFPWPAWEAWRDAGFAGLAFPEEFGGQGGGLLAHAVAVEEVARVCASSALFAFISKFAMTPLLDYGGRIQGLLQITRDRQEIDAAVADGAACAEAARALRRPLLTADSPAAVLGLIARAFDGPAGPLREAA